MSIALDPINLDPVGGQAKPYPPIVVKIPVSALNTIGLRIMNLSPLSMKIKGLPGAFDFWLTPYVEQVVKFDRATSLGQFTVQPYNLSFFIPFSLQSDLLITVFQDGDVFPNDIPIVHGIATNVTAPIPAMPTSPNLVATGVFAAGAAGSISITAGNDFDGNPMFTYLMGIDITADIAAGVVHGTATLTDSAFPGSPFMNWRIGFSTSNTTQIYRVWGGDTALCSVNAGAPNTWTLAMPAITSGPSYTLNMWGYKNYQGFL